MSEMLSTPSANDGGHAFEHDASCRHGNGLQARGAEAVDDGAADRHRQTGAQHGLAADIASGRSLGVATAPNQVFDQVVLDAGALDGGLYREGAQLGTLSVVEFAAVRLGQRGAGGGYDDGFTHGVSWNVERRYRLVSCLRIYLVGQAKLIR